MSEKAMVYIDGGWLYKSRNALFEKLGAESGFEIDYARLPKVVCEDVADQLDEDISLVRTFYFGTIPSARSGFNTAKQYSFYDFLEHNCGYETDIHEVDVGPGERVEDGWLKVSLTSKMMYYATLPGACDIIVFIGDDLDFMPVLQRVRQLGKRVQIVALPGASIAEKPRISDFPTVMLDSHAEKLRLVRERIKRVCKLCGQEEETTWAGPEFYCTHCRGKHRGN